MKISKGQCTSLSAITLASSLPSCQFCSASQGESWDCISQNPFSSGSLGRVLPPWWLCGRSGSSKRWGNALFQTTDSRGEVCGGFWQTPELTRGVLVSRWLPSSVGLLDWLLFFCWTLPTWGTLERFLFCFWVFSPETFSMPQQTPFSVFQITRNLRLHHKIAMFVLLPSCRRSPPSCFIKELCRLFPSWALTEPAVK